MPAHARAERNAVRSGFVVLMGSGWTGAVPSVGPGTFTEGAFTDPCIREPISVCKVDTLPTFTGRMSRKTPHIVALLTLLALSLPAAASNVVMSGPRHRALLPPDEPKEERAPGPRVTSRDVVIETLEDGLRVEVRWRLDSDRPGWFAGTLIGPQFHVESIELGGKLAVHGDGGGRHLYGWIEGPTEIAMVAVLDGWQPGTPVDLSLLQAPRGVVVLDSEDFELALSAQAAAEVEDAWWTGAGRLGLGFERPANETRRPQTALVTAQSGVGITVLDNELMGRGRMSWQVLRGEVASVGFSAAGLSSDVEITGPNVKAFRREGGRMVVELIEPSQGRIDAEVTWSQVLPQGPETSVPLASLRPEAFRVEQSLQLARGGDREIVPRLSGVQGAAASELPLWGQGLIEGTPTAAFTGTGSGSLSLLRFEPVSGPPVVVDVAQYTIATSAEGRVLMRALYEVRNERSQWLDVRPPEGMSILGARVGADTAFPIEGEAGTWRIPLLRSVETVEGLLTFPVEVALIGEVGSWDARTEERELGLPALSAEVALSRVTLYLPPGYDSTLDENEAGTVPAFSEGGGIAYGFSVGESGAAQADALFQDAVSSWMDNDFDEAQVALDNLRNMGGDNENVRRLQSNLDLVSGNYDGDASASSTRRIREQARARSLDEERQAEDLRRKAEEAQVAGDYGGSSGYYSEYIELTEKLQRLEQEEAVEYKAAEREARRNIETNAVLDNNYRVASTASKSKRKESKGKADRVSEIDFEHMEVSGELVAPQGTTLHSFEQSIEEPQRVVITNNAIEISAGADFDGRSFTTSLEVDQPVVDIFDKTVDVLGNSGGEFAGRDLLQEALVEEIPEEEEEWEDGWAVDGVAGGVEGGVIGGVVGGVSGGAYGAAIEPEEVKRMAPVATGSPVSISRGRGGGGGGRPGKSGRRGAKASAAQAPPPSARPTPAPDPSPAPPPAEPADDSYDYDFDAIADEVEIYEESDRSRSRDIKVLAQKKRGPSISFGARKEKAAPDTGRHYEPDTIEIFSDEPDVPEVTATSLSIVVPNLGGQTVLYQQLLLTAGGAPSVLVRAKKSKDRRSK